MKTIEDTPEWDEELKEKVPTAIRQVTLELGKDEIDAFAGAGEKPLDFLLFLFYHSFHPILMCTHHHSGLEIWKIEKMQPVRIPKKKYGKFYAGDSYICLSTAYKDGRSRTLEWALHYWIGRKAPKVSANISSKLGP